MSFSVLTHLCCELRCDVVNAFALAIFHHPRSASKFFSEQKPDQSQSAAIQMANKTALVILPGGAEEMEFVIVVDVLRRAGIEVTTASLSQGTTVTCSRNVVIVADKSLEQVAETAFDVVVLPGGLGGSEAMSACQLLGSVLKRQEQSQRLIAAICAAPLALLAHSVALGKRLTSYPAMKPKLAEKYEYVDGDLVVQDGQLITSRGPGTAFVFGLRLAEALVGAVKAKEVAGGMLLNDEYKL